MMLQKILRYLILAMFLLNLATVFLNFLGPGIGSLVSYASFMLLIGYYILFLRGKPNWWLVFASIAYYMIASFDIHRMETQDFVMIFLKTMILVIFGQAFYNKIPRKDMAIFLAVGSATIVLNAVFFPSIIGRSSGFYFNPNAAGYVCMLGYALAYSLENRKLRYGIQIVCSLAGFLTFSRTFMILWLVVNLISVRIDMKNARVLVFGFMAFVMLLIGGAALNLGGNRFDAFRALIESDNSAQSLATDSRTETWAKFYDAVAENPIFGGGYGLFQGGGLHRLGAHNTYLLIIGESGIIPLIIFIAFCIHLLKSSFTYFDSDPATFLMALTLVLYLATTHNFFDNFVKLSTTLYIYGRIIQCKQKEREALASQA